jgi:uncharacterized protein (TIGR00369 family)
MTTVYPPDRHLLRDLRLSFEHQTEGTSRAWMPVVPELAAADGAARAGALATLVDVIGGGLAAQTAQPDWIATADLTLHLTGAAASGSVEARARVAHAGRTTVVIEVTLHGDAGTETKASAAGGAPHSGATAGKPQPESTDGHEIGTATMSFARLPRRDTNPDISSSMTSSTSSMALPDSRLQSSLVDELGICVVDFANGVVEAPVVEWSRNSLGSMQGGAVAVVVDAAAQVAAEGSAAGPVVVTDLQLTYLALARVGPLRTRVDVLEARPGVVVVHVEVIDMGAEERVTTVGRVVATTSLRDDTPGAEPRTVTRAPRGR